MIKIKSPLKHKNAGPISHEHHKQLHGFEGDVNAFIEQHDDNHVEEGSEQVKEKSETNLWGDSDVQDIIEKRHKEETPKFKTIEEKVNWAIQPYIDVNKFSEDQIETAKERFRNDFKRQESEGTVEKPVDSPSLTTDIERGFYSEEGLNKVENKRKGEIHGAINVGLGSTPHDLMRASQNPNTPTVVLTEEDYIVKYSDGGFDYTTTVSEAIQHNYAINSDDPLGLLGGENSFKIVLKAYKADPSTTDAMGSSLLFPADASSYAVELRKIQESDLSDEEKQVKEDILIDRYEDFINLEFYHNQRDKTKNDRIEYEKHIKSTETAKDMSGLYYSPRLGFMDEAMMNLYFVNSGFETIEDFKNYNLIKSPEEVATTRLVETTRYNTYKGLDEFDRLREDDDTHAGEIAQLFTSDYFKNYNLNVSIVDDSGYDGVHIYAPTVLESKYYKGAHVIWETDEDGPGYTEESLSREYIEQMLKELEKQRLDPRGNITLLNAILHDVAGEKNENFIGFDYENMTLDTKLKAYREGSYLRSQPNLIADMRGMIESKLIGDFDYYFKDAGMTLVFDENAKLILKRDGKKDKEFNYSHEVISYLAKHITKEEMNSLTIKGKKYQNEKYLDPIKEYEERLKKEISTKDYTSQDIVVEFVKDLYKDGSEHGATIAENVAHEADALGLDEETVRVPIDIDELSFVPSEVANIGGNSAGKSLNWWADRKAKGEKMDFDDFYEDVFDYNFANRPFDMDGGEDADKKNAKIAWTWLQEIDRRYNYKKTLIREDLYNVDYSKQMSTFIQNLKSSADQIVMSDFGVALYVDANGVETVATEEQIKADVDERVKIYGELVEANTLKLQDAMQQLANEGWMPVVDVNEDTGEVTFTQLTWEGEGEEPEIPQELVDNLYDGIDIYHKTRDEIASDVEILYNQEMERRGDELTLDYLQSEEFVEMNYWENFGRRFSRGTDNVILTIPALLGNDAATDQLQKNNKAAQFEKSYEWGEGDNWGAFGMVWADQGANLIYFVSTLGVGGALGLGTNAAMAVASTGIGLQSAGGKHVQLKTLYENAEDAEIKLAALDLEYDQGFISDKRYLENKKQLNAIVNAGDISPAQHIVSVIQTGVVEGTFTYGFGRFGAGRINTAKNIQNVFNATKKGHAGILSYNGYTATRDVFKGVTVGTLGEIAEESSIYLTTEFIDSWVFDRKGDYSQLSKVMIDAAVMSSTMNSMSLTANTVLSHNMRKEARAKFEEEIAEINQLKNEVADIDLQVKKAPNPAAKARLEKIRAALNDKLMQLEKKNFINWQNYHIQVLGMNEADQKAIFENEKLLNQYYLDAGISSKDVNNKQRVEDMFELHKARLNKKKKGSGDTWLETYYEIQKSNEELKGNFDMETAAKAIYGPDYRENGSRKEIQDRINNDKSKKGKKRAEEHGRADAENKLRLELDFIQEAYLENAGAELRTNKGIVHTQEANTGDAVYEVNGVVYETKKDFLDAVRKQKDDGKDVVVKVENDNQTGTLVENILSQNSENDVTVEENTYNSDGDKVVTPEELKAIEDAEIAALEQEATEEATEEVVEEKVVEEVVIDEEGEVKPVEEEVKVDVKEKRKVTIVNDRRHQTEEQWEDKHKNTKNYKHKRHQRDRKQKQIYDYLARTHYAGGVLDLQTFEEGDITSKNIAEEVKKVTGKDLVFDEVGSVDGLLKKIVELNALDPSDANYITPDQAQKLGQQVRDNRKQIENNSNGFILGNTFFVINKEQAIKRITEDVDVTGEGSFLQGAAWIHETGHYLDNVTKTIEEISQKGIFLNEFLLNDKSERAQILNEAAEYDLRRMSDGEGFYLKPRETILDVVNERKTATGKRLARIDNILDEYIREVTSKMKTEKFAKLRQDVTKRGRSMFAKFRNPDYKVRNAREAVFEVVSFIEDFKKGRLSESYRVQIEAAKGKKGLAGEVRSEMQQSVTKGGETIEQAINNLVRNEDGSLMTREEYVMLLDEGIQTKRRKDKKTGEWVITKQPHPANLLTNDPSLPGNDWLNGSIRNLGTRMEGGYIGLVKGERDSMDDFMQAVKDQLTTAITNYNPETKYKGAAEGDLSGWLAQTIIYKKPGVIDDFRKLQETRAAAKDGGVYKRDKMLDVETVEGTVVFARKLGFTEEVIGQDENGNDITRNAFDLIVEEKLMEVLALDPKTYKDTKSLIKAKDAVLVEVLNLIAKEFGVKPSKLIEDASLTTDERTSIQLKINSIGARSMLNMMPEGFNSLGDANGVQPVFLDGKKGKAINSETGETNLIYTAQEERLGTVPKRVGNKIVFGKEKKKGGGKGLRIQKKNFVDNISEADYLNMLGITPVGTERRFRTEDKVVDGPLRGSVVQVATIVANQSITKIAEENGLVGLQSMKDGKGDLMFSSIIDASGQDAIQHMYWYGRNKFHKNLDGVALNIDSSTVLKQQITKALETTWPETTFGKDAWIGDDKVDYKGKLIKWYSDTLRRRYVKYTDKSVVIEGQDINSFLDFLMAEDAPRDDVSGTIAKLMNVESITPWIENEINRENQRKFNRTTVTPYTNKVRKRYNGKSKIKNEDGSLKYPKLTEEQVQEKVFQHFYSFRGFLNNGYQGLRGPSSIFKNNDFYTENFLTQIYPNLDKVTKVRGKNEIKLIFKNGETKTIKILQEYAQKVTKEMIATTNEDGTIDSPMTEKEVNGRKQLSEEAIQFTDDLFAISADVAKSKTNKFTKMNFAVFAAQMNSHPTTPLRMGAVFTWAALDPHITNLNIDGDRQFEFEHGMAARVVNAMFIMKHWFGQDISLEDIKKAYEVGALHVDFNDNVGRLFGARMNFNYQIGDSALKRWLNRWTKSGASHALYNVFTGEVEGRQQAEDWKKIDAHQKGMQQSSAINNARTTNHNTPSRGMSAWDFDDTLATTKSGVRARVPNSDGTPQPNRKVIFLAGGAGSGKGNVISKLGLEKQGFKIVNSDISLEWLKENSGLPENMNDFTKQQRSTLGSLQHQARGIAKRKMMKYQGNAEGVVVDGTGGSINAMGKLVNEFKDKGYDVSMVFVETSLETALERNQARKERSLLDKIVEKNHAAVQGNKDGFKTMFGERFMEVKTDNLTQEDAMPASLTNKMNDFVNGYKKVRLDAEEFATQGAEILEQGGEFDFTEFDVVTEGEVGPMFQTALDRAKKFGTKDTYVLTARPVEAAIPIQQFLASQGLNIPIENITGLGNSTGEAKAQWMLEKFSEGYNDMYFADDALQNVEAVKNVLDQLDIKSKVIQAKIQFSKSIDYTTEKLFTNPALSDIKEESSINNVKDVNRLANEGVYSSIQFSKKHRGEYENLLSKHRPDLVKEGLVSGTVDNMFTFIDSLNIPSDQKRKYERITTKWLATSNIKLKEDGYKIKDAVDLAEKNNLDVFSYNNPNEIIEKFAGKAKAKPTNPDTVELFVKDESKTNDQYGITEYVVTEDRQNNEFWIDDGQQAVRKVIDTHWGPKSNPWCICARDKDGTGTMHDAMENWDTYSDGPKRIIFQNGKLIAMYANGQYWDRMDNATDAPVIRIKEGRVTKKVELVPIGKGKVQEFVMETRTVSKDKKTVTTEYHVTKNMGEDTVVAGDKLVEDRVNGITVKQTEYRDSGTKYGETKFENGKAVETRTFMLDGRTQSINDTTALSPKEHGDLISHEIIDGKIEYWFGVVLLESQGLKSVSGITTTEIGFKTPTGFEVMDVTKRVDGKLRVDFEKILEVDPDAKGIPSERGYTPVSYMQFSKGTSAEFNEILERATKVEANKTFSEAQARIRGSKKKFRGIIPASAQDFMGLIYNFLPRGKEGEAAMDFFKKTLIDPFARGINELNTARQTSANDYKNLTKQFPKVKKKLNKKAGETNFTNDQAVRVYLWNKAGFKIPGLSNRDLAALDAYVKNDPELQAFADALGLMSKKTEGYSKPGEYWLVENIASDLMSDGAIGDARSEFLAEWQQNADQIFSKENLNKIEAIYGSKFREAIEDMLYRMKTGKNRPTGSSRIMNTYMNWVNNSVGAIMFLNIRSAVLQTISATNYVNWTDNNPLKAAAAFANQKQFWSDFVMLFNSDYLKQRRTGNRRGVNETELSAAVAGSENKVKAALAWLLSKGFTPTQIADSFAIASGGATFYRNRVKTYLKQGMSKADAETQAFLDFQERTEVSQQSARPDMISQQQANPLGRLILAFQNTPMQYARIMNKAARDLANNRGDAKHNISKIMYYGFVQAVIFGALQSALFAVLGDDDEEEFDKKKERIINQMIDSWLTGIGYGGKAISTIKNTIMEYQEQDEKGYMADHTYTILKLLGFSPPIGSKLRKIYSAIQTEKFNEGVSEKRGWTLDNPTWSVIGNVIEGITNIPLGRISQKMLNLDNAMDPTNEWWERVALVFGWNTWDLGVKDKDIETVKEILKEEKKVETKKKQKIKKEEKKIEKEKEEEKVIESNIEKQKQEKKDGKKEIMCAAVSKSGKRCKTIIEKGSVYCTIHIEVEQGTKEVQCKKVKKDKKRCGMMTKAKSGYCYYHD
jgi:hypothetical protein